MSADMKLEVAGINNPAAPALSNVNHPDEGGDQGSGQIQEHKQCRWLTVRKTEQRKAREKETAWELSLRWAMQHTDTRGQSVMSLGCLPWPESA